MHGGLYIVVQRKQKGRDIGWLKTMLSSGTLSDKMASMILLIQVGERMVRGYMRELLSIAGVSYPCPLLCQLAALNGCQEEQERKCDSYRYTNMQLFVTSTSCCCVSL